MGQAPAGHGQRNCNYHWLAAQPDQRRVKPSQVARLRGRGRRRALAALDLDRPRPAIGFARPDRPAQQSDALQECINPRPKVEGGEEKPSETEKNGFTRPATTPPVIDAKLAAAFKAAGIGSNAWPKLAELEHITPAYVKAHDAYRREHGESTGLLITRLRCGDPVPEKKRKPVRDGSDVAAAWQKDIDERRAGQRRKR